MHFGIGCVCVGVCVCQTLILDDDTEVHTYTCKWTGGSHPAGLHIKQEEYQHVQRQRFAALEVPHGA